MYVCNLRSLSQIQEAVVADLCRHPCVVNLLDAFVHTSADGQVQYSLVYQFAGQDLSHKLAATRPSPAEVRIVMHSTLRALAHMHSKKIIHTDVKPQNIFVQDDGGDWVVVLGDLGCPVEAHLRSAKAVVCSVVWASVGFLGVHKLCRCKQEVRPYRRMYITCRLAIPSGTNIAPCTVYC
jgi:serine/threonine protein kinase